MKKLITLIAVCVLLMTTGSAQAADIAAGKAKAALCAGCHGSDGISGNPAVPSLAGQQAVYTVVQLKAYKEGSRKDTTMNGIAAGLSDADIENLAAYYASLKPMTGKGDATAAAGKAKYGPCQGCHGAASAGQGLKPRLAGQQPAYIVQQLKAYRDGSRKNHTMNGIAAALSEEDMKALAEYVAGLK